MQIALPVSPSFFAPILSHSLTRTLSFYLPLLFSVFSDVLFDIPQ